MFLRGLTEEDVKILDAMWAIDTREELQSYLNSLSNRKLRKALTLLEMIKLAFIDDMVEAMDTYPEAEMMLRNIMH